MRVDVPLNRADPDDYDALVLPGGVMNPDKLRQDQTAVSFVRSFFEAGKPVAAICHGPWMLAEADVVRGRRLTSWPSLKTDLRNAGAEWTDEQVVIDNGLALPNLAEILGCDGQTDIVLLVSEIPEDLNVIQAIFASVQDRLRTGAEVLG